MDPKTAGKVGLLVVIAAGLLVGLYFYLGHVRTNAYKVRIVFDDVRGLSNQSVVRMSGVSIGEVTDITLQTHNVRHWPPRPVVTLAIDDKYDIPSDAQFAIVSGLLITTPQIEVHPRLNSTDTRILPKDGSAGVPDPIPGEKPGGALAQISPELAETVHTLNSTFTDLNGKIGKLYVKLDRVVDHTDQLVLTSQKTIGAARGLIGDPQLKEALLETVKNFRDVSRDAKITSNKLSADLSEFVKSGKGKFDKLSDTAIALTTKLGNTIDDANQVVKKLTEQVTDPRLQQTLQETLELGRSTLASVDQITKDVSRITGDPSLPKNISETAANLNAASAKGRDALDKLDSLLGKFSRSAGKAGSMALPKTEILANVSEHVDPSRLRVDADARFAIGKRSLIDIGLFDIGEDTRFNLQYGARSGDSLLTRYGLYASKLGAGLEYQPAGNFGFRADLYDTDRPRLDVRALFRVNNNASFWIGEDGIFRGPVPVIGVQIKP